MSSKEELDMAYQAGRAMATEPAERHGLSACPFEEGDPQRAEWVKGYGEVLEGMPTTADLELELKSSVDLEDQNAAE